MRSCLRVLLSPFSSAAGNQLTDDEVAPLIDALATNTTLNTLNLKRMLWFVLSVAAMLMFPSHFHSQATNLARRRWTDSRRCLLETTLSRCSGSVRCCLQPAPPRSCRRAWSFAHKKSFLLVVLRSLRSCQSAGGPCTFEPLLSPHQHLSDRASIAGYVFSRLLNPSLRPLTVLLSACGLDANFLHSLGEVLSLNRHLKLLNLSGNTFGREAQPKFTAAVGAHAALSELDLECESPACVLICALLFHSPFS